MTDHYRTLEIERNATPEQIKAAYRKLAKKYHPDKNRSEKAERIFNEISKAYNVLSDPAKKRTYDQRLFGTGQFSVEESEEYQPVYEKTRYSQSTLKKGMIFGAVLLILVLSVPLILLRYSSKYNYDLALEYYQKGQLPLSLMHFDRAIKEFGSRKIEASFMAVNICYDHGYIAQGIAFAQKGLDYISDKRVKGDLYYREGLGWEMLEQYMEADKSYKNALKMGYQADSLYMHLGMIHGFELDNFEEAALYFDHLIEESGLKDFKLQRGITFQKIGKDDAALQDLTDYVYSNPQKGMGYFFLGISQAETGHIMEACSSFHRAWGLGVEQSEAYLQLYCENN